MEQGVSKRIGKKDVLYNNLLLLGLKPEEVLKTSKIEISRDCLDKENQKAVHFILYFLLQKMLTEEEMVNLKLIYPPRNLSEKLEFTKLVFALLQKLEQDKKVPKNFIVGKSILELTGGDQITSFLRFLSELCLRSYVIQVYPSAKIPAIRLTVPKKRSLDPHDVNEFFHISSLVDEKSQLIQSISPDKIQEAIKVCSLHIKIQRKKFFKKANNIFEDYEDWKKKTGFIISEYVKQKDLLEVLQRKRNMLKNQIDKKYFTEMRALDRIPQVDLCSEVNRLLQETNTKIKQQKIDLMLKDFIDKTDGKKITDILEISNFDVRQPGEKEKSYILNDLLGKFANSLTTLDTLLEKQQKGSTNTQFVETIDDLIAKKKKNIEFLRQKRKEFLKISSA